MRVFIIIILVCALVQGCGENKPQSVASQYWQAVLNGDEIKRQLLVSNQRETGVELYFNKQEPGSFTFGEAVINGDIATIDTAITLEEVSGPHNYATKTILIRTNDEWKIDARATRKAYVSGLFSATIENLQNSLSETANEFRRIGEEIADTAAVEASKAAQQLQRDAEQAGDEVEAFLNQLDKDLVEELKKYSAQPMSK